MTLVQSEGLGVLLGSQSKGLEGFDSKQGFALKLSRDQIEDLETEASQIEDLGKGGPRKRGPVSGIIRYYPSRRQHSVS